MRERSDRNVGLGTHEGTARTGLATVVQTTLESAQVWVWTRERQPAEAAGAQGKFWEMYELLLQPASHLDLGSLLDYAADLGLDVGRFRDGVTGQAYAAKIERDVREGIQDDVNATPKFYVDGERIDGKLPLEGLEDAIRAAVRAASAD